MIALMAVYDVIHRNAHKGITVSWVDDIHNPDNEDYVSETVFNNNIDVNVAIDSEELQFLFCQRYYETLDDSSLVWYHTKLIRKKKE